MIVYIKNIQGFRGEFSYSLSDTLNIINSKYNGVGKTTLYDCIKFLVESNSVDKDEQKYFLNLEEELGTFQITNDGVTHGFQIKRGMKPRFFCKIGESVDVSGENFPTAAQDIGILLINDVMLNIFDKQINLFSSSSNKGNYELIREVTTHKPTEEMLQLLSNSIEVNKEEQKIYKRQSQELNSRLDRQKIFTALDLMEQLLNSDAYENAEIHFTEIANELWAMKRIGKLEASSDAIYILDELAVQLHDNLIPSDLPILDSRSVENLDNLLVEVDTLQAVSTGLNLNAEMLTILSDINLAVQELKPVAEVPKIDLDILNTLDSLVEEFSVLTPIGKLDINTDILITLESIARNSSLTRIELEKGLIAQKEMTKYRTILNETRIQCPIRQEVYLVNGECQY